MNIVSYSEYSELDVLEEAWERLSQKELQFVPTFSDLRRQLENGQARFQILVDIDDLKINAMACFVYLNTTKRYDLASRTLFRLPVRELSLFGSCVLGQPTELVIRKFFQKIIRDSDFDLINAGMIFVESPLFRAINDLREGVAAWKTIRRKRLWWLIRLPASVDEYNASLSKNIKRDCQKQDAAGLELRIMCRPDQVDRFLVDADKISRSTYQWKLGPDYFLCNDERTRQRFNLLSRSGTLRCYILCIENVPCAFGWGELAHRTFAFEQTGYDPQYRKMSPGTTLMVKMVRDLIENTDCEVFDFKWGGEDGYKSRLGNTSIDCVSMHVARMYKPYSLLIMLLDRILIASKNLVGRIVESDTLKHRLRAILRKYGVGTF